MQLVTRAQWGARPPSSDWAYIASTQGVKIHYEGTAVPADLAGADQHGRCAGRVRDIQASHMANTSEGWIDIAYNAMVCPHGAVFEGRGLHHRTGANGNQALNAGHYAVCAMVGDSGLTQPTDAQLNGLRDAIEWFQQQGGAGGEIRGHRDGYNTSCPGGPLYAWVQAGAPRPGGSVPAPAPAPAPVPAPQPSAPAWPGRYLRLASPMMNGADVRQWQQRMRDRGWSIVADGWFGPATDRVVRQFQTEKALGTDGVIGPKTWAAAWTAPIS
jgi:hypothetical protein